ncbi:MAG TPA: peptide ABC transporter substrate-binding protein [Ktedonobacteraceae bacterium]|nr:peptide ABC transporter substrate-binding protein [Ktedonobacteraceae bacterium]
MHKRQKSGFLSALICLFTLFLTSCSFFGNNQSGPPVKASADKQVLILPKTGISDFATLDPAQVSDLTGTSTVQMLFTGLVQIDDHMQVRPQIAKSWELGPDGMTWTFHLKPNLKFSDGTPLTAKDVAYSLNRALLPATKSTIAPIYLGLIKDSDNLLAGHLSTLIGDSIVVNDSSTLVITTSKKAPYFLSMLSNPCADVVEKSLIDTYGSQFTDHLDVGGSSGPFKTLLYTHGKELDLVPNPYYYGPRPQLRKVILPFYQQTNDEYMAYQEGKVDISDIPTNVFPDAKKRDDFHQVPQLWVNYYTMNYLIKPFDNIKIRQAFELAIDKNAIARTVWQNTLLPTNHIIPQGMPGYNPDLSGPDGTQNLGGNPNKARILLQEGLQEEKIASAAQLPPIKLTYVTGVSSFDREVSVMIQMWQKVLHVNVTPNPVDFNTLLDQVTASANNANGLQFWGLAWIAEYPDPQNWLSEQFGNGTQNNSMNYGQNTSDDAARQVILQQQLANADSDPQPDTRQKAYQQAEQQLINEVAWMPMEQITTTFLRKAYVIGMVDNAQSQIPPDDWANIYIAQH